MKTHLSKIAIMAFVLMESYFVYSTFPVLESQIQAVGLMATYKFQIGETSLAIITFLMILTEFKYVRPLATVLFLILPTYQIVVSGALRYLFREDLNVQNFQVMLAPLIHYAVLFLGTPYLISLKEGAGKGVKS